MHFNTKETQNTKMYLNQFKFLACVAVGAKVFFNPPQISNICNSILCWVGGDGLMKYIVLFAAFKTLPYKGAHFSSFFIMSHYCL